MHSAPAVVAEETLLVVQHFMPTAMRQAPRRTYSMAQHRVRKAGRCWIALPGEVERWWTRRSWMTLGQGDEQWLVEGQGGGRDQLNYRVEPASPSDTGASGT